MKVIVTAGGTGGHIYPALAIIDKLSSEEKDLEVLYIGTHNRMEKELIPAKGINYEELEIYGLSKTMIFRNIKNLFLISKAYKKCLKLINDFKPDIVIGTGGYVTYPVFKAAKKLGVKTFLHEQNSLPGKTNRILANNADLVGVSFKNSEIYFKTAKKVFYSGNPCASKAILEKEINKKELGLSENKKLILIVAGSLGSETFNNKMKVFLNLVKDEKFEVLFITGKNHYNEVIKTIDSKNVIIKPYVDNLTGIMKKSDLIISRAGASTISEILALNIPSILVPSPFVANNHQYFNAVDLVNMGVSQLIEEKYLTAEKLFIAVNELIKDGEKRTLMLKNLEKINEQSPADLIYKEIKEVLK